MKKCILWKFDILCGIWYYKKRLTWQESRCKNANRKHFDVFTFVSHRTLLDTVDRGKWQVTEKSLQAPGQMNCCYISGKDYKHWLFTLQKDFWQENRGLLINKRRGNPVIGTLRDLSIIILDRPGFLISWNSCPKLSKNWPALPKRAVTTDMPVWFL